MSSRSDTLNGPASGGAGAIWPAEARLAGAGHRVTRQRRAVIAAIAAAESGLTASELYAEAHRACSTVGLATVYRTLELLADVGALRRIHGPDRCEMFALALGGHGHAVVCTRCGRVREFTGCDLRTVVDAATQETGYAIAGHILELSGICRGLTEAQPSGGHTAPEGDR